MTRKHYEAIAEAFRIQLDKTSGNPPAEAAVKDCAEAFARIAANDNPRFDTRRFISACGIN